MQGASEDNGRGQALCILPLPLTHALAPNSALAAPTMEPPVPDRCACAAVAVLAAVAQAPPRALLTLTPPPPARSDEEVYLSDAPEGEEPEAERTDDVSRLRRRRCLAPGCGRCFQWSGDDCALTPAFFMPAGL